MWIIHSHKYNIICFPVDIFGFIWRTVLFHKLTIMIMMLMLKCYHWQNDDDEHVKTTMDLKMIFKSREQMMSMLQHICSLLAAALATALLDSWKQTILAYTVHPNMPTLYPNTNTQTWYPNTNTLTRTSFPVMACNDTTSRFLQICFHPFFWPWFPF